MGSGRAKLYHILPVAIANLEKNVQLLVTKHCAIQAIC